MAGGRSSGSGSSRRDRSGKDPLRGLADLGQSRDGGSGSARLANEGGLTELGERIDGRGSKGTGSGPRHRRGRRQRRRWSTKRRVLTTLGIVLVLFLGIVGSGYAYLRLEWNKVTKVKCTSCAVTTTSIEPFNVLIIGSDSRAGNTGQAAESFGTASAVGGQRSDTIKILHVNPETGTAELLSIPRDTWVEMSGLPASSGLTGAQKINTAFNNGPVPLVDTIQNTFGIPIDHFVVIDFSGVINAVQAVGGINMNFNYPVRDCSAEGCYYDNSGLKITTTGCQTLNGNEALALARSRYFEYDDPAEGGWNGDPSSDLGRIQRQNEIIEALIQKVESTYNPLTLKSFLDAVVPHIAVDQTLGLGELYDLANRYHAFSSSKLQTFTLPTLAEQNYGGDIQVVQEPEAQEMLTQFLGNAPNTPTTPPLDENDDPISVPAGSGSTTTSTTTVGAGAAAPTTSTTTTTTIPPFDPTPC